MESNNSSARSFISAIDKLNILMRKIKIMGNLPKGVFGILLAIDHHCQQTGESQMRLGEMCAMLHRPMPSITRSVNALEEEGLVRRTASKSDRRAVYISLTGQGQQAVAKSTEIMFGTLDEVFEQLGAADTRELLRLLHKMGDILKTIGEKEEC